MGSGASRNEDEQNGTVGHDRNHEAKHPGRELKKLELLCFPRSAKGVG
jgi:hypothetical protein